MTGSYHVGRVSRAFAILWWLVPAALLNSAIDRFAWNTVEAARMLGTIRDDWAGPNSGLVITCGVRVRAPCVDRLTHRR